MQAFFEYRWKNDNNQALVLPKDMAMYGQLPEYVQTSLYIHFLH